jgi:predicted nucleotidyltransferase
MSNTSNPHLVQLAKPLDTATSQILRHLNQAAVALKIDYFVTGAMARDFILVNVFGFPQGRATRDIDFGVAVEGWEQFEVLEQYLCDNGPFERQPNEVHRLRYSTGNESVPVDVIPFGGITDADGQIAWPPDKDVVMTVAGFREAQDSAIRLVIDKELTISVASLAGLTVLKLLAWMDRRAETNKDASDLYRILSLYADAGNQNRLYESEFALVEEAGYNLEMAGARLLGRDAATICLAETKHRIQDLLHNEALVDRLILQMSQVRNPFGDREDQAADYVQMFRRGFLSL